MVGRFCGNKLPTRDITTNGNQIFVTISVTDDTTGWAKSQVPFFSHMKLAHVLSNLLLSAGILAQYKTYHVEIKTISIFLKGFCLVCLGLEILPNL